MIVNPQTMGLFPGFMRTSQILLVVSDFWTRLYFHMNEEMWRETKSEWMEGGAKDTECVHPSVQSFVPAELPYLLLVLLWTLSCGHGVLPLHHSLGNICRYLSYSLRFNICLKPCGLLKDSFNLVSSL